MDRILLFDLVFLFFSCGKSDQAPIPTFLSIQKVNFESDAGQGTTNQLFSEVWIYADSQLIGAYPIPSQIPLLGDKLVRLDVFAGIRENGQAMAPRVYAMVAPWRTQVTLQPEGTVSLTPTFKYSRNIRVSLLEDFETSNLFRTDLDGDTLTRFEIISENAIQGKSARAKLTALHPQLEVANNFPLSNLPQNGSPVYLELEYASEMALAVGLKTETGQKIYKLLLFANDLVPQKIYVNFTAEVEAAKSSDIQITFLSTFEDSSGKPEQEVIIDNIKLLHFQS